MSRVLETNADFLLMEVILTSLSLSSLIYESGSELHILSGLLWGKDEDVQENWIRVITVSSLYSAPRVYWHCVRKDTRRLFTLGGHLAQIASSKGSHIRWFT